VSIFTRRFSSCANHASGLRAKTNADVDLIFYDTTSLHFEVVRRLAAARTALRWEARRRLQAALGAGDSELESLARMLRGPHRREPPDLLRSE
jgi:hypothetical protein